MSTDDAPEVLNDDEVAEIEARANATTEGPWEYTPFAISLPNVVGPLKSLIVELPDHVRPLTEKQAVQCEADYKFIAHAREDIPALCATVRALRQQIAELTAEWCECGHAKTQHGFFSDHDECYECDQMSEDLCCHWRPAPRATDTYTALREQLALAEHASKEFKRLAEGEITRLRDELAEMTQERDELLRTNTALIEDNQTVLKNFKPAVEAEADRLTAERLKTK